MSFFYPVNGKSESRNTGCKVQVVSCLMSSAAANWEDGGKGLQGLDKSWHVCNHIVWPTGFPEHQLSCKCLTSSYGSGEGTVYILQLTSVQLITQAGRPGDAG